MGHSTSQASQLMQKTALYKARFTNPANKALLALGKIIISFLFLFSTWNEYIEPPYLILPYFELPLNSPIAENQVVISLCGLTISIIRSGLVEITFSAESGFISLPPALRFQFPDLIYSSWSEIVNLFTQFSIFFKKGLKADLKVRFTTISFHSEENGHITHPTLVIPFLYAMLMGKSYLKIYKNISTEFQFSIGLTLTTVECLTPFPILL